MDPFILFFFYIVVLIISVIIHEVSHGAMANRLGDPTARLAGRLTLNPIVHIDLLGSIVVPLLLAIPMLFGAPTILFGWAKPVPYNPHNLSNQKWGPVLVGIAGPIANFLIAIVFGLALRVFQLGNPASSFFATGVLFAIIVYLNLLLGIFNLLPIPPLDGSKILFAIPGVSRDLLFFLERYGFIFLILFIFFGFQFLVPLIYSAFHLLTGYYPTLIPS